MNLPLNRLGTVTKNKHFYVQVELKWKGKEKKPVQYNNDCILNKTLILVVEFEDEEEKEVIFEKA